MARSSPKYKKPSRRFFLKGAASLIAFAAGLIALTWFAVIYDMERDWEEREESVEQNLDTLARALEGHVNATVHSIDSSLQFLRREYRVHPDGIEQQANLIQRTILEQAIVQIAIINADGVLTFSTLSSSRSPVYLGDRPHFLAHRDSPADWLHISEPVVGRVSQRQTLQFSRKLTRKDGSFGGVIVLSLDINYFKRFYDSLNVGAGGVVTLVGTDHIVRARSVRQEDSLGRNVADFQFFAPGAPANGHFHQRSPIDQIDRLFSYRTLSNIPLIVVVGISEDENLGYISARRRVYYGVAAAASLGIALFVGILLSMARRQYRSQARFHHLLENAAEGMIVCDRSGIIRDVNRETCRSLQYPEDELIGYSLSDIDLALKQSEISKALGTDELPAGTLSSYRRRDGSTFPVEVSYSRTTRNDDFVFVMFRDVTQRKEQEERIWRQANFDNLTGLPNRSLFHDRLKVALAQVKRNERKVGVMFLDLDRFKWVNDNLGHDAGDDLLCLAAKRLRECVREGDTVARLGGDEFTVILPGLRRDEEASVVAGTILETLDKPFHLEDQEVQISCSIGIAVHPDHGTDPAFLLKNADSAMYQAKKRGRGQYAYYVPENRDELNA